MAFEIVFPTSPARSIERGKASIFKPAKLRMNAGDLATIKVTAATANSRVTLLADFATGRIAVRKARDGEPSLSMTFAKRGGTAHVPCGSAVKAAGLSAEKCFGIHDVTGKDDMLIVSLK